MAPLQARSLQCTLNTKCHSCCALRRKWILSSQFSSTTNFTWNVFCGGLPLIFFFFILKTRSSTVMANLWHVSQRWHTVPSLMARRCRSPFQRLRLFYEIQRRETFNIKFNCIKFTKSAMFCHTNQSSIFKKQQKTEYQVYFSEKNRRNPML